MIRCIECGRADLQSKVIDLTGVVRGEEYTVRMRGLVCPKCGYQTIEGTDSAEFARLLSDKYRAAHSLLTSEQIRALRKGFGETQEQFAKRLGVGIASVKRWEMGKIQDERSNQLILDKTKPEIKNVAQYCGCTLYGMGGGTEKAVAFGYSDDAGFYTATKTMFVKVSVNGSYVAPKEGCSGSTTVYEASTGKLRPSGTALPYHYPLRGHRHA